MKKDFYVDKSRNQLVVSEYPVLRLRQIGNKLECELSEPSSMQIVRIDRKSAKITKALRNTIPRTYAGLVEMAGNPEIYDPRVFSKELKILEREIGKTLTPILKDLAFTVNRNSTLALALDDETVKIPWELGLVPRDKAPGSPKVLLSDAMSVGRLRVVKEDSWLDDTGRKRSPSALVIGIDYINCQNARARRLQPLKKAEEEARNVATILKSLNVKNTKLLCGEEATFEEVTCELAYGPDIVHFTGHGVMSRNNSKICLWDSDLDAEFYNRAMQFAAPALAFFNACESSIDTPKKTTQTWAPYNWAYAMAYAGGKAFIGTLWSVCEPNAGFFAKTFYQEFLGIGSKSLAESMRQARIKTRQKEGESHTWPGYVLYGPPTLLSKDILS